MYDEDEEEDTGHATTEAAPGKPLSEKIRSYKQFKNSYYLGRWDIPDGKRISLKIEEIRTGEVVYNPLKNEKNEVTTVSFVGAKKRMILGQENAAAIASHYGENPHDWIGKTIVLYVGPARNRKLGIRIEPKSTRG